MNNYYKLSGFVEQLINCYYKQIISQTLNINKRHCISQKAICVTKSIIISTLFSNFSFLNVYVSTSSWKDRIFLFNVDYTHHVEENSLFMVKKLYISVIFTRFRTFWRQQNKQRKCALENNGNCSGKFDAINKMQKQILNLSLIILILQISDFLLLFTNWWKFKFFSPHFEFFKWFLKF